jgi:hypothetical protein
MPHGCGQMRVVTQSSFQKSLRPKSIPDADGVMRHPMRRIVFVLVAVIALAGVVPTSGEAAPIFGVNTPPDTATGV